MTEKLDNPFPAYFNRRTGPFVLSAAFFASVLLVLSFPIDADGSRGGGSAPSRGGGSSSSTSSGGGSRSSGGGHSSSSSSSSSPRSSSGGGRSYSPAAPRSSSSGGRSATGSSNPSSYPSRSVSGDRGSSSSSGRTSSGSRTVSATGSRSSSGVGGYPGRGGGYPGGGYPGRGYHGGGRRGWYCPPTYYPSTSWYWGGPWNWWWGWGPYWGLGSGWRWGWGGGVYVINESTPASDQYGRVDTDVSPEAAEVYLDGTLIGQADDFDGFPDHLYLETGKYRLEFRHPYYETIVKEIDIQAGQAVRFNDEMKLLPGKKKLQVVDPKDTGTPLGRIFGKPGTQGDQTSGDRTGRFEVKGAPGVEIDEDDEDLVELDALDEDGQVPAPPAPPARPEAWRATEPKGADLAPSAQGRLRFEIEPDDSAVYVDDRYVGTAKELAGLSRGLRVNPGRHVVTVVRPGYGSKTVDVESKPGAAIDVVIELEK